MRVVRPYLRLALFLASAVAIFAGFYFLNAVTTTLNRLDVVEVERDRWQRPGDVIQALNVREGSSVVDLGSGAGYFSLKLAAVVGKRGEVFAVDLRKVSLNFLRLRALLRNRHNIAIVAGAALDPRLPSQCADAVLIANTYHEFADPPRMLAHVYRVLRPGGRLVIVDRGPRETTSTSHEVPPAVVEDAVRRKGFVILSRDDRFIDPPGDEPWWLLIAKGP